MTKITGNFETPLKIANQGSPEDLGRGRQYMSPDDKMGVYDCVQNIQYKYTFDELDCTDVVYDLINN